MLNQHVTKMNSNAKTGKSNNNNNVLPSCSSNNNLVADRCRTILRSYRKRDADASSLYAGTSCTVDAVARSSTLPFGARLMLVAWLCCTYAAIVVGAQPHPFNYYNTNEDKRANFEREFLSFGKRASDGAAIEPSAVDMQRNFMSFGKRAASVADNEFGRQFMPFGKRATLADLMDGAYDARQPLLGIYTKKNFDRQFLPFGKREAAGGGFQRDFMAFGRRRK